MLFVFALFLSCVLVTHIFFFDSCFLFLTITIFTIFIEKKKKGYAQSAGAQSSCAICAPGQKRQNTGASDPEGLFTACVDCDSGNYQNEQGQNNCKLCTAGYYSGASAAAASCSNCLPGKYSVSNICMQ